MKTHGISKTSRPRAERKLQRIVKTLDMSCPTHALRNPYTPWSMYGQDFERRKKRKVCTCEYK